MATTLWVPVEVPPVYSPLAEIVPTPALPPVTPSTCQMTAVFVAFVTVAVNCCVCPGATFAIVGAMVIETGACVGTVEDTVRVNELLLNTAPLESQAFTVIWCCPLDMLRLVLNWFALAVYTTTLSRYTFIAVTGCAVSVVPATSETGEATVAPFAGEQIVTEGEAGLSVHWAAEVLARSSGAKRLRAAVNSRVLSLKLLNLKKLS